LESALNKPPISVLAFENSTGMGSRSSEEKEQTEKPKRFKSKIRRFRRNQKCPRGCPLPNQVAGVRDPKTPRNSGWPTVSGQPLRCLNVIESSHGIVGASWIEGISIEIGD
jgi:hypothetical protein